ncbi:lipoprotein insertase outer membrane protein LolB [Luteimonas sp. MJ293]|uniref:lipoprotein insertase outer membrane protein LolB n=1 Tax=Luteimonas sp. MJ146 TaxID=3129240 RepID=UPI0031BB1493
MNVTIRLLGLLAVLVLAGCVSRPVRAPDAAQLTGPALAAAQAQVSAREAQLAAAGPVAFSGRVALSNGRDGGSGRLEWWQAERQYQVMLRAPITRQGWSLSAGPDGARIDGLDGGPLHGPDPMELLYEATGMQVPIAALAAWAAGTRADQATFGVAQLEFSAEGRLVRIRQGGWTIDYVRWQPQDTAEAGEQAMALPARIDAERGQARVRLMVDEWSLGAPAPGGS